MQVAMLQSATESRTAQDRNAGREHPKTHQQRHHDIISYPVIMIIGEGSLPRVQGQLPHCRVARERCLITLVWTVQGQDDNAGALQGAQESGWGHALLLC